MFYHLQYIHLFRPFLKYTPATSPLPAHVSPRRICTANAGAISKLMRLYKKLYDLRQICNIAVYMVHSACTIHILNLPEKTAKRDINHGVKHLEEIAEDWLCARRSLGILSVLARKWNIELPEEAALVLQRTDEKYGTVSTSDVPSPSRSGPLDSQSPRSQSYSPASVKQDQFNPPSQFDSPVGQPMSLDLPTTSTVPQDMLNNLAVSGMAQQLQHMQGQQQQQPPQQMGAQPITTASMPLSDGLAGISGWAVPAATRTVPGYPQAFAHVHNAMGPAVSSPSTSASSSARTGPLHRQVSAHSLCMVDGQEWYLKDGVNWQQNFESWGLGGPSPPPPPPNPAGSGTSAAGGMGDASSVFMFRGLRGGEMDPGFDSLGSISMGSLDHLPGLD